MSLGNSLFNARKKSGLSQEEVAEKLGVSRQTISKWELDETLPDIRQAKKLSSLYHLSLDELIDYDMEVEEIERAIEKTSEATQQKIDWNAVWGKKYPVLTTYRQTGWRWRTTLSACRSCWRASRTVTATTTWMPCWCSKTFWRRSGNRSN